jgi:gluconate 2-dehydrogenase gamma chain
MSRSGKIVSRRSFLGNMLALGSALSISAYAPLSAQGTVPAQGYSPKYFTKEEWAFLNAACGRLIPRDDNGPGAAELGVPEFIDREMEGAFGHAANWYMQEPFTSGVPEMGYQSPLTPREVYRAGIAAVDSHCLRNFGNRSFSELPAATQDSILKDLENGALDFERVSSKSFFDFLLQNTKEGYLADPIHGGNKHMESWRMIGFPGARADYLDWVDKPGARYPLGPVGIAGRRG